MPIISGSGGGGGTTLGNVSTVTGTPSVGQVIVATSGTAAAWQNGGGALLFSQVRADNTATAIDTGANGIAGGYNVLEIFIFGRTDEAGLVRSTINVTLNNDGSAIYDRQYLDVTTATVSGTGVHAAASWQVLLAGASAASGVAGIANFVIPAYAGTTLNKHGTVLTGVADSSTSSQWTPATVGYRSTTAISRLAVAPATGGVHLLAGTAVYIYGR